ncbi:hypothetical protein CASFOL_000196 [Castilleja foliolosa]|uniref:YGGT family protein n=1 Tax=Castilleja foliolosa TaxID=1961234 RepID=A0ABD3EN00_9LAMI
MDSSHLSSKHSSEDKQNCYAKNPASQFPIFPLSSPTFNFIQISPFSRQPLSSSSNPNLRFLMETLKGIREVQKSIISNVEKCLKGLDNFRSPNEVLDKVLSFSSHLQNACQLPRRNYWNLAMPSNSSFAAILPGDSVATMVATNGILNFLNIYNTLLVVRLVLTWFPTAPPAIVSPLSTICDPYLNIFRGVIPPLGGLDLSPILAFLILNAFTSAAAALPAELPSTDVSKDTQSHATSSHLTASQKKWMRRFSGRSSNGEL